MQADTAIRRLETLPDLARAGKQVNGLYRLLTYRPLWTEGLDRIKRNKGAGTPGTDGITVNSLGKTDIETLISQLMEGTYRPKPVRRVYIPKANGKLRPLGIPTAKDRLVQEVVRSILDQIYEPIFSDHSHGFRQGRSCHTALKQIQTVWTGAKWLVEVDIKGYFDNIDHSVLLMLLKRRIDDEKFLSLIRDMLKAGFLEQWRFNETYSGTPQGGIISPLLANIYLHELDLFMEEYIRSFDKGKHRARNLKYHQISERARPLRKRINRLREAGREDEAREEMVRHDECRAQIFKMPSSDPMDLNFKRLRYIRYADDFLMGIIGSKEEARSIMCAVKDFLTNTLNLEISTEKSGIRKASEGVRFLGYDIRTYSTSRKVVTDINGGHKGLMRTVSQQIQLSVPREKVQAFATKNRYGLYEVCKATHRNGLLHCDDVEIAKIYNAEMRGFANYYAFAWDVKRKLNKLQLIWQSSLFRTLAAKHKSTVVRTMARCRISPGNYVVWQEVNKKRINVKLWTLREMVVKANTSWTVDNIQEAARGAYCKSRYVDQIMAKQCVKCGSTNGPFELHHINPMRTSTAQRLRRARIGRERKAIPLCKECHGSLHAGRLNRRDQVDGNGEPDEVKASRPVRWEGEWCSP